MTNHLKRIKSLEEAVNNVWWLLGWVAILMLVGNCHSACQIVDHKKRIGVLEREAESLGSTEPLSED